MHPEKKQHRPTDVREKGYKAVRFEDPIGIDVDSIDGLECIVDSVGFVREENWHSFTKVLEMSPRFDWRGE